MRALARRIRCGRALAAVRCDAQAAPPTRRLTPPSCSPPTIPRAHRRRSSATGARGGDPGARARRRAIIVAGLYEHGPGDVPRIAAVPAWNAHRACSTASAGSSRADGPRRRSRATGRPSTCGPRTARTAYEWVDGSRRTSVRVETFISRAAPGLAARPARARAPPGRTRAGPVRARRVAAAAPAPARHAHAHRAGLGTDGAVVPRAHGRALAQRRRRRTGWRLLSLDREPRGSRHRLRPRRPRCAGPRDLPGAKRARARGRAIPRWSRSPSTPSPARRYTFTQLVGFAHVRGDRRPARPVAAPPRGRRRGRAATTALAAANARAWARRWETDIVLDGDPELQRVVRAMLFYLLCSADSGTAHGHPADGPLERRVLRPRLLGLRHLDVSRRCCSPTPTWPTRWSAFRARTLPAARGQRAGERLPRRASIRGRPTSAASRPRRTSPRRTPAPRSTSTATSPSPSGSTTSPPATPRWLAREGFPVHPRNRRLLGEPRLATTPPAAATTFATSSRWPRGSSA